MKKKQLLWTKGFQKGTFDGVTFRPIFPLVSKQNNGKTFVPFEGFYSLNIGAKSPTFNHLSTHFGSKQHFFNLMIRIIIFLYIFLTIRNHISLSLNGNV